jgi:hypothetical protein
LSGTWIFTRLLLDFKKCEDETLTQVALRYSITFMQGEKREKCLRGTETKATNKKCERKGKVEEYSKLWPTCSL